MFSDIYRTCAAADLSNRPVLMEGSYAIDLRHIRIIQVVDVVGSAVAGNSTANISIARCASSVLLDDIPFGDWIQRPSVNGQGIVSGSGEVTVPCKGAEIHN